MKLPALVLFSSVSAGHQEEHIGVISLESGPPPAEDADSHLRTGSPPADSVRTNVAEHEGGREVPGARPGFHGAAEVEAAPSSLMERSASEARAACTLSRRFRSKELVAAEEEDLCAAVTTEKECGFIDACEWSKAVERELSRERSFLQGSMGPDIRVEMTKYCQIKSPLTTDDMMAAGVASKEKAAEYCVAQETEELCLAEGPRSPCRFGCFPPECGCFLSESGMLQALKQDACDPYMNNEEACMRTAGTCVYRNAGLLFGFPVIYVAAVGAFSLLCLAACCFYCVVNMKPGHKHHHHHHHAPVHQEEAQQEEEWEEEEG